MAGSNKDFITWDEYFMSAAFLASLRSKDPKNQIGACIVQNNRILSVGYNGATIGFPDEKFPWDSLGEKEGNVLQIKDTFVVHAEQNAIDNFRGNKRELEDATIYVTWFPCNECAKRIIQNGIKHVVYARMYSKPDIVEATLQMFHYAGVEVKQYKNGMDKNDVYELQNNLKKLVKKYGK